MRVYMHRTWQEYMVFSGFASTLPTASKAPLRPRTALWPLLQGVAFHNCFRMYHRKIKKIGGNAKNCLYCICVSCIVVKN